MTWWLCPTLYRNCCHILFHNPLDIYWTISGDYESGLCVGHDWQRVY